MKPIKQTLIIFTSVLVISQFIIGLLTNYASANVPAFFINNPRALWILIGVCLLIIIVTSLITGENKISEKESPKSMPKNIKKPMSESKSSYDLFISYSHYDSEWVHGILIPKLEKHGFSVLVDTRFSAGEFSISQIEAGVQNCKHVIAVLTPEYLVSDWGTLENVMAQTLDPATRNKKLIPVLLKNAKLPLRFSIIHYRDLRDITEAKWNQLIQDLM
jgi:hypothetical protein